MKNQLNKILKITLIILLFSFSKSYSIEDVSEFTDAIDEVREEFNNISEASTEQSKIIDEALKEIDKATEYVQEAINNDNAEDAIKTLEFIEKSLSDVESIIPQEFGSDMSNIDTSAIAKEDMDVVNEVTAQMKTVKEEKLKDFMADLVDLNQKGIDTVTISENLNSLGIDTIKIDLNLDEKKKMETWTKEEWANSYKGSVLTSDGSEVITDQEINTKVGDLEQKLQVNTAAILDKRSSLTELQTKIDPLSGQITELKTQKSDLLAKYNEEILKQSSTILSDDEINKSKELAGQFNSQLSDLTNQIKTAEQQSNSLQEQVQGLNLELANEIATKSQLEQNISNLNNQLRVSQNLLAKKELELDQLKNSAPNLNKNLNELNSQLEDASLQKDFVQVQFERSIDKEVEAFNHYAEILWDGPSSTSKKQEVDFAMREVSTMLDNDPKKQRILEIEKYGIYAGLSDAEINKGINAIQNDDWEAQKEVTKSIYKGLSKSSEWNVSVPSNAEINVIIAEEKAIQEASLISLELQNAREQVQKSISEKTKDIEQLRGLNTTWIKYSSLQSNVAETDLVVKEIDKILEGNQDLKLQQEKINQLTSSLEQVDVNADQLFKQYNDNRNNVVQNLENLKKEYNRLRNLPSNQAYKRENWDRRLSINMQIWNTRVPQSLNKDEVINLNKSDIEKEIRNTEYEISSIKNSVKDQARENLIKSVEEARIKYDAIVSEETKPLREITQKVADVLNRVPTFDDKAELVADLDPAMMRAKLYDFVDGTTEARALEALRSAMAEIGDKPVSEYMTGPYWEMTNVKAAAILKSKKYSWIDDYAIYKHYNPLNLSQSDLELAENQLSSVLKTTNPKLDALNEKIAKLSEELEQTKSQSLTINDDINNLESELTSLKSSESEIQNQISDLSNQFSSKENLIAEKTQNLASLQEQLNPLSDKMSELEGQRADLDTKLNTQLNTIANQIESQGKATDEANALKAQFESQIAELDGQLKDYENQSVEINNQLASLTTELSTLESETPEIANQIESLNQDLENFINIKADLAMATAEKYNLEIQEKVVDAVKPLENKSIISIEGTNIFRVVDSDELLDNSGKFKVPTGTLTLKGEVYTAGAVQPEKLFSFAKINNDEEINGKILELEKQFEAGTLTEEELRSQRDSLNATRTNMKVEFSEVAAAQFAATGSVKGGEQVYNNSTLGSWVLVNATTGEQMTNPLTGHSGSMVCEGSVCGMDGELGKQASAFGGMYVLESLADKEGNVSGICSGGGCKFDVDTLRVLGPDGIANNVFNDSGEGLFQQAFTGAELNEIEKYGMTTLQRKNAIEYAMKNNIEFDASKFVDQDSLDTQAKALAFAAKSNTFVSEVNKQAGSYVKFKTDEFKKITSTMTYAGKELSSITKESPTATFKVVDGQIIQKTAQEIAEAQAAATEAASSATEVASAAAEAASAASEVANEVAQVAQEAAQEAAQVASKVLTGNDVEELSKLANDALGAWVLVDAATGKQMTNPINGASGSIVCTASNCGGSGYEAERAKSFGGVYVLEALADPETGNVAGACGGGNCEFDIGN